MSDIKVVRLVTGEDILCEFEDDELNGGIKIINGVQITPVPSRTGGDPNFAFLPFPLTSKEKSVTIKNKYVVYICEPLDEFRNQYNTMFGTGIVTPPNSGIIV
jgi:hypothetical protein